MKKLLPSMRILFYLSFINLFVFIGMAKKFGGDALSGKVADGHYFLASHGKLTEVSATVYHYSEAHALSLLITQPLGMLAGGYFAFWLCSEFKILK